MRTYAGNDAIGLTDAVNAVLAWVTADAGRPRAGSHYYDVIAAPTEWRRPPLEVIPGRA